MGVFERRIVAHSTDTDLAQLASTFSHYREVVNPPEVGFLISFFETAIFYVDDSALLHYYYSLLFPYCSQIEATFANGRRLKQELNGLLLQSDCSLLDRLTDFPELARMLELLGARLLVGSATISCAEFGPLERLALALRTRLVVLTISAGKTTVQEYGMPSKLTVFFVNTRTKTYFVYPKMNCSLTSKALSIFAGARDRPAYLEHQPARTKPPLVPDQSTHFHRRKQLSEARTGTPERMMLSNDTHKLTSEQIELQGTASNLSQPPLENLAFVALPEQGFPKVVLPSLPEASRTDSPKPAHCCSRLMHSWWSGAVVLFAIFIIGGTILVLVL